MTNPDPSPSPNPGPSSSPSPSPNPNPNPNPYPHQVEFQENILPKTRKKIEVLLEGGWTFDKIKWDESCERHKAA
jgi:hypothetical protein